MLQIGAVVKVVIEVMKMVATVTVNVLVAEHLKEGEVAIFNDEQGTSFTGLITKIIWGEQE